MIGRARAAAGPPPVFVSSRQDPEDGLESEASRAIIRNSSVALVPVDRVDASAPAEKSDRLIEPMALADSVRSSV
jgi:hypothetical protein